MGRTSLSHPRTRAAVHGIEGSMTRRAVILDIDGTLIDSNEAHAQSWVEGLASVGIRVDIGRVRKLIGMGGDQLLPALVEGLDAEDPRGKEASKRRDEIFERDHLPHIPALPGARDMVQLFRDANLAIGVATSSPAQMLHRLLAIANVDDLVDIQTDADDVDRSKPAPDVVKAALSRLGVDAHLAVMIGDTPYDIASAARAKVPTIAFRSGRFWSDDELRGALAIYDGPSDLAARWRGIETLFETTSSSR